MMSGKDETLRVSSMTYFLANHQINGYGSFQLGGSPKAIMPLQGSTRLVPPSQCFYNPRASITLDVSVPDNNAHDFSRSLSELHDYLREQLAITQTQYQEPTDRRRSATPPEFVPSALVWLNTKNIKMSRPTKKLDHKRLGPFKILSKISDNTF